MTKTQRLIVNVFVLLPVIMYLLISGMNGYKDIDKRFFVVSIGIDEGEESKDTFKVTLKLAIPGANPKQGASDFTLISEENESIAKAIRLMKANVDKELDFGHTKVIILGRTLIENRDLMEVMDWFERRRDIQRIAYVAVGAPTAKEVLAVKPKGERLPANSLFLTFGHIGTETPHILTEYLFMLRRSLHENGIDSVLPYVELMKQDKNTFYDIKRTVVFYHGRARLLLGPEQSKFFTMLVRRVNKTGVDISYKGKNIHITLDDIDIKYDVEKHPLKLIVKGNIKGLVEESEETIQDHEIKQIEQATVKAISKAYEDLIQTLQENKVDPIGYGLKYRAKYQSFQEDQWYAQYTKAEVETKIQVHIAGIGIVQ